MKAQRTPHGLRKQQPMTNRSEIASVKYERTYSFIDGRLKIGRNYGVIPCFHVLSKAAFELIDDAVKSVNFSATRTYWVSTYVWSLAEKVCSIAQVRSCEISGVSELVYSYPSFVTNGEKRDYIVHAHQWTYKRRYWLREARTTLNSSIRLRIPWSSHHTFAVADKFVEIPSHTRSSSQKISQSLKIHNEFELTLFFISQSIDEI